MDQASTGVRRVMGGGRGLAGAMVLCVVLAAPVLAQDGFRVVTPPGAVGAAPMTAAPAQAPRPVPVASRTPATASHGETAAGRYAVLRGEKDTGCMITLEAGVRGPRGSNKAILAPACRDSGLLIFDPVGWELSQGRLVLMARKGHDTHLDRQSDGTWLKDPKEGKPLTLRKI